MRQYGDGQYSIHPSCNCRFMNLDLVTCVLIDMGCKLMLYECERNDTESGSTHNANYTLSPTLTVRCYTVKVRATKLSPCLVMFQLHLIEYKCVCSCTADQCIRW